MSRRMLSVMGLSAVLSLALAACGSSGPPPRRRPRRTAAAPPRRVPRPVRRGPGRRGLRREQHRRDRQVSIVNFAFNPADDHGQGRRHHHFTNGDSAGHTATLDDGSCFTPTIASGKSDGLTFTAAGTYPFHCSIHSTMKGTITVS